MIGTKQIKEIITLDEEGSIVKAAKKLGTTQSTLSKHISRVEDLYGEKLFFRNLDGVTATPFGQEAIVAGKKVLHQLNIMNEEMRAYKKPNKVDMKILTSAVLEKTIVDPTIAQLFHEYPDLNTSVSVTKGDINFDTLINGDVDLLIMSCAEEKIPSQLDWSLIVDFSGAFITRKNHPLVKIKEEDITEEMLMEYKYVTANIPSYFEKWINKNFPNRPINNFISIFPNIEFIKEIIQTTDLIALGPSNWCYHENKNPDLCKIKSFDVDASIYVVLKKGDKQIPIVNAFIEKIKRHDFD